MTFCYPVEQRPWHGMSPIFAEELTRGSSAFFGSSHLRHKEGTQRAQLHHTSTTTTHTMSSCGSRPDGAATPTGGRPFSLLHLLLIPSGLRNTSAGAASSIDPDFLYNVMCEAERIADEACRGLGAPVGCSAEKDEASRDVRERSSSPAAAATGGCPSIQPEMPGRADDIPEPSSFPPRQGHLPGQSGPRTPPRWAEGTATERASSERECGNDPSR
jgi:hypothetical protein